MATRINVEYTTVTYDLSAVFSVLKQSITITSPADLSTNRNTDIEQLLFYVMMPFKIPEEARNTIAEFITRANYGLRVGNFEMDFTDGEIRYKTSIDVEGDHLSSALVKPLVYTNVTIMDKYLPGIIAVVDKGIKPVDVIAQVEV